MICSQPQSFNLWEVQNLLVIGIKITDCFQLFEFFWLLPPFFLQEESNILTQENGNQIDQSGFNASSMKRLPNK